MKMLVVVTLLTYWVIREIKSIDFNQYIPSMSSIILSLIIAIITYAGYKRGLYERILTTIHNLLPKEKTATIMKSRHYSHDSYSIVPSKDNNSGDEVINYKSISKHYNFYKKNN
jgi:hypothetical protein